MFLPKEPKPKEILYEEIETGIVYKQVNAKPVTLVPRLTHRAFGQVRRPTKVTLATKYRRL